MRFATSLMIHQSCCALPAFSNNPRWRLMRRSLLVTVPSFSLQPVAGSFTLARRAVSVSAMQSLTTTRSHFSSAAFTLSALGKLTTGLVAITHTALILPSSMASNISTAMRPG